MNCKTIKRIYYSVLKCNAIIEYFGDNKYVIKYANGSEFWYLDDKRHRKGGPAIECVNGYKSWYLNGDCLTEKEFNERIK